MKMSDPMKKIQSYEIITRIWVLNVSFKSFCKTDPELRYAPSNIFHVLLSHTVFLCFLKLNFVVEIFILKKYRIYSIRGRPLLTAALY